VKLVAATILTAALALCLTPMAAAKDLTKAEVCGQSGCAALPRDKNGDGLIQLRGSEGREVAAPPKAAPYYLLVWEFGPPAEGGQTARFATMYVPSADLVAAPGMKPGSVEWFGAAEPVLARVRAVARTLEPFPAPKRWPTAIAAPANPTPTAPTPAADGRAWLPWVLTAVATLIAIGLVFALGRRMIRVRRESALTV
jgi:hypothetical protein